MSKTMAAKMLEQLEGVNEASEWTGRAVVVKNTGMGGGIPDIDVRVEDLGKLSKWFRDSMKDYLENSGQKFAVGQIVTLNLRGFDGKTKPNVGDIIEFDNGDWGDGWFRVKP